MPVNKDLKRLVRARMAATQEKYTTARAALVPEPHTRHDSREPSGVAEPPDLTRLPGVLGVPEVDGADDDDGIDLRALILKLSDPETARPAGATLKSQPPERLVPALIAGLENPDWRVRRSCCRLLDDLDFIPESLAALQRALDDPDPRVRRSALHTLSCQHCKPSGCALEIGPLFERMANDPSRKVRQAVLYPLGWQRHGPWAERLVERMAANDPSEQLRAHARRVLANKTFEQAANAERRLLPERLRLKTERHPYKWVGIDGEQLVAGDRSKAVGRDFYQWMRAGNASAVSANGLRWYFVLPDSSADAGG